MHYIKNNGISGSGSLPIERWIITPNHYNNNSIFIHKSSFLSCLQVEGKEGLKHTITMKKLLAAAMLFMLNSWSCFSADTPRAEYPRPQFEREQWVNLNGTWTFDFDFGKSGKDRRLQSAEKFDKNITVPFCPESKLSGVGYTDFIEQMWYQRNITIPSDWNGKRYSLTSVLWIIVRRSTSMVNSYNVISAVRLRLP